MDNIVKKCVLILGLVTLVLCQEIEYRLPDTTYPIEYNILLNTPLDSNEFTGTVEIKIGVNTATNEITVNQYNLDVHSTELLEVDGDNKIDIPITSKKQDNSYSLQVQAESEDPTLKMLKKDKEYVLKIGYTGYYNIEGTGIYKSTFTDENGDKISMISTNFLPQYARYAFPCYDEPQFKTPFTISIQYPDGYQAISNMGQLGTGTKEDNTVLTTKFRTTPSLPTHSIAFAVTRYKSFCSQVTIKICAYYDPLHTQNDVQLILETAHNAIQEFEQYLGVALELSKLDIIPVSRLGVIMGNYGLLINKESVYYYNSKTSSVEQKDLVIRHTIRQIVNIYFINILTPEWWTDVWINNGISIILEHIIADKLYPEIDATGQFIDSIYQSGFKQQIIKPASDLTYSEIILLFGDEIQYKSAGILRMFQCIMGENKFTKGLKELANANIPYSAETFFDIFQNQAVTEGFIPNNYDLNTIINTWITQISYPIFQATKNYKTGIFTLSQKNVLTVYDDITQPESWYLPYNFITQNYDANQWEITTANSWLDSIALHNHDLKETLDNDKWIIYNKELSGFYHTNYDTDNWYLIAGQLEANYSKIPMISRTQLVHDSIFFALNEKLNLDVMFKIVNYIDKEVEYAPISRFLSQFLDLDSKIFGSHVYSNFTKFTRNKIQHLYDRVRITDLNSNLDLSVMDAKLRERVIKTACDMGYKMCLEDTNKLVIAAVKNNDGVNKLLDSEFGYYILTYGLVSADEELFWEFIKLYNDENYPNLKYISEAIGYVQDAKLIDQLLNVLTTRNGEKLNQIEINLQPDNRLDALLSLAQRTPTGLDKTLAMMKTKSNIVQTLFNGYENMLFLDISSRITTDERLENFIELAGLYSTVPGHYIDIAQSGVEWASKKIPEFETFLGDVVDNIEDDSDEDDNDEDDNDEDDNDDDDNDEDDNDVDDNDTGDGGAAVLTFSTILMLSLLLVIYASNNNMSNMRI